MGNPISSDLLKHDNDTINTGCSLDDSNGLANCTTSPTVFVLACCSPLTGNGRCCLVFVSEEENSKKHPLLSRDSRDDGCEGKKTGHSGPYCAYTTIYTYIWASCS